VIEPLLNRTQINASPE